MPRRSSRLPSTRCAERWPAPRRTVRRRDGAAPAGLHTNHARRRRTVPARRYSIRFDGPVHQGLPSRQRAARPRFGGTAVGAVLGLGRGGAPRAPGARHRPGPERHGPVPCQWIPTSVNRRVAPPVEGPLAGHGDVQRRDGCITGPGGAREGESDGERDERGGGESRGSNRVDLRLRRQGLVSPAHTMLTALPGDRTTTLHSPYGARAPPAAVAGSLALAAALLVVALPAAAADDAPRVLVAEFDNDVNPVTQDYLQDVMERAERRGLRRRRDRDGHTRRARLVDAGDRQDDAGARNRRDRVRRTLAGRAPTRPVR